MVFSTNQNRQLYVLGVDNAGEAVKTVEEGSDIQATLKGKGDIVVSEDRDGYKYGVYKGAVDILRTDLINPKSIMWATASAPEDMQIKLKAKKLTITEDDLISGEDYILRINFRQFYGMSDEDIYQKYGAVHCTKAMKTAPKDFISELAYSLVKNFSREYSTALQFSFDGTAPIVSARKNGTTIKFKTKDVSTGEISNETENNGTTLYIMEASQVSEWALGTKLLQQVYFDVIKVPVKDEDGNDMEWGTLEDSDKDPVTVSNGYKIADLEYFCMGERGDQYRNVGWPKSILTTYLVNPADKYYVLDIHYAYRGTCEDIQKSEKTMTFVSTEKADIDTLITKFGINDVTKGATNYGDIPSADGEEVEEG